MALLHKTQVLSWAFREGKVKPDLSLKYFWQRLLSAGELFLRFRCPREDKSGPRGLQESAARTRRRSGIPSRSDTRDAWRKAPLQFSCCWSSQYVDKRFSCCLSLSANLLWVHRESSHIENWAHLFILCCPEKLSFVWWPHLSSYRQKLWCSFTTGSQQVLPVIH